MVTRREVVTSAAAVLALGVPKIGACSELYRDGDNTWWQRGFREQIVAKLRFFFNQATGYFPLEEYHYDGSGTYPLIDQFLLGFLEAPRPVEALSDGRWLFSGSVARNSAEVSYVAMSADQSRIDAAMMSYDLCPQGGVDYVDPQGGTHKVPCEADPGWVIFISRNQARDNELIASLGDVALTYRRGEQRRFIAQGVRASSDVHAKTVVVPVP
jgi:hypothetical protein